MAALEAAGFSATFTTTRMYKGPPPRRRQDIRCDDPGTG
ncbi:hypothetical protein [Mesorhizobium sp. B2-3-12]|nr:hypothetical protein [Mesorhizobium sp. B2-3-12]